MLGVFNLFLSFSFLKRGFKRKAGLFNSLSSLDMPNKLILHFVLLFSVCVCGATIWGMIKIMNHGVIWGLFLLIPFLIAFFGVIIPIYFLTGGEE